MLDRDADTGYLSPGEQSATLDEIEGELASNFRRREIMAGLRHVVTELVEGGARNIWIDGSFVTSKERPGDVDVVYEPPAGVDVMTSSGVFSFARRGELKKYRKVDLWPHPSLQPRKFGSGNIPIVEWWQSDINGNRKGIIKLQLEVDSDDKERSTAGDDQTED